MPISCLKRHLPFNANNQKKSSGITLSGYQARKIREMRNLISVSNYGKPFSVLRLRWDVLQVEHLMRSQVLNEIANKP